jgi:hypothetical protein
MDDDVQQLLNFRLKMMGFGLAHTDKHNWIAKFRPVVKGAMQKALAQSQMPRSIRPRRRPKCSRVFALQGSVAVR